MDQQELLQERILQTLQTQNDLQGLQAIVNQYFECDIRPDKFKDFQRSFSTISRDILHKAAKSKDQLVLSPQITWLIKLHIAVSALSTKQNQDNAELQIFKISFIEDVYDCLSLGEVPEFFNLLSTEIENLQKIPEKEQYMLLKICNAILKRLSRTHQVEMRGKIHIFLTKLLPICHKSLRKNTLERQYNLLESKVDENQIHQSDIPLTLYKSFWALQKYLNQPDTLSTQIVTEDDLIDDNKEKVKRGTELNRLQNIQTIVKVIQRILFYYRQNPLKSTSTGVRKRFPKFLTQYYLFKDQLNDPIFRRIFLTQILLFCFGIKAARANARQDEEKNIINNLEQECKDLLRDTQDNVSDNDNTFIEKLIKTELIWPSWREKGTQGSFEQAPCQEIQQNLSQYKPNTFSQKICQKSLEKKQLLVGRLMDDLKFKQTTEYSKMLKEQRIFKVETTGIEPGLNYYLNDVLYQIDDPNVSESDRYKNMKEYTWKSIRVISKFLLKELKIDIKLNEKSDIQDLEELTKKIKDARKLVPANMTIPTVTAPSQAPIIVPVMVQPPPSVRTQVIKPRFEDNNNRRN